MRPLFPERVTQGNVPVAKLTADGTLNDSPELKSYTEVEPEPWVRRLLADVDRVTSHAFAVDSGAESDAAIARGLARVAIARDLLGTVFAADVRAIFGPSAEEASLEAARRFQRSAASAGLAPAFDASLLVLAGEAEQVWSVSATRPVTGGNPTVATSRPDRGGVVGIAMLAESSATGVSLTVASASESCDGALRVVAPRAPEAGEDGLLDPARLPVPLRTQPVSPLVVSQTAEASPLGDAGALSSGLGERLARWDYGFDFSYVPDAWQDEAVLAVSFAGAVPPSIGDTVNQVGGGRHGQDAPATSEPAVEPAPGAAGGLFFAALAQYEAVADGLLSLLIPARPPTALSKQALATFADLVTGVARTWSDFSAESRVALDAVVPAAADPAGSVKLNYRLRAETEIAADGLRMLVAVWLTQPMDVPAGIPVRPTLLVTVAGGEAVRWTVDTSASLPGEVCYRPAEAVIFPRGSSLRVGLTWAAIDLLRWWKADTEATVERNRHLPGCPQGGGVAACFVLRAPMVRFAAPITALVERPEEWLLEGAGPGAALVALLERLLGESLLTPAPFTVSFELTYTYPLAATGEAGPEASLPVVLVVMRPLDSTFGADVDARVGEWISIYTPPKEGASWRMNFTLYPLRPESTESPAPLLRLDRLVLPVSVPTPLTLSS